MTETDGLLSIGELARRSSLPVKTLRYYSDIGLLPPARRTSAGYRLYGEEQRLRLDTIKTLRGLGFGLADISAALQRHHDLRDTIELQLHAVEGRIRELQRVAVVLRAALERADEPTSAHLARLETLARLSAAERIALLDDFLDDVRSAAVPPGWWAGFRAASLPELPADPTSDQLDAWLELAVLLADTGYRDRIRQMVAKSHEHPRPADHTEEPRPSLGPEPARPHSPLDLESLFDAALEAEAAGLDAEDPAADPLVARFVSAHEPVIGPGPDAGRRTLAHIDRYDDPRSRRYWQLVARIQGWPDHPWPHARAFDWLLRALRARVRSGADQPSTSG
ncbi:MAG TPA: MerR family transcriptional regulator [Euzebyales bacterium]|nr:MerR family transcriptional regulator [Euzebyales bacterium]